MATNGVILLNLNNRNAAEFNRILVPGSYEKASGALEAGAFVTVYKWLYQGFMMGPSICNAVAESAHINLVDKTNGGVLQVYSDDTIYLDGAVTPNVRITPLVANNNGVYDVPSGYDGYGPVTVNVSGGAGHGVSKMLVLETDRNYTQNSILVTYWLYDLSGEIPTVIDFWSAPGSKDTQRTFTTIEGFGTIYYDYVKAYDSYRFEIVPSESTPYLGVNIYHIEAGSLVPSCGIMSAGGHYVMSQNNHTFQMYKEE